MTWYSDKQDVIKVLQKIGFVCAANADVCKYRKNEMPWYITLYRTNERMNRWFVIGNTISLR